MLKTQIFANKVSNLTDARYFAAWGVEWLCFNLDPNTGEHIPPQEVYAIKEWVAGPKMIGAFGMMERAEIQKGMEMLGLDGILLGNFSTLADAEGFRETELIRLVVADVETKAAEISGLFESWKGKVNYFLLDLSRNGFSWEQLKNGDAPLTADELKALCTEYPVLLAMDCKETDLPEITGLKAKGLVLEGGAEEKIGLKSFDALDEILEALAEDG